MLENDLNYNKCDFCGSCQNDIILVSKDYVYKNIDRMFKIVRCKSCGLVFTNPRLKKDILEKYYYNTEDFGTPIEISSLKQRKDILFNKKILANYFKYPLGEKKLLYKLVHLPLYIHLIKSIKRKLVIPSFIPNGKILEIGCAYGTYLYQLKILGWEVKGIELSKKAANYGINNLNLEILNMDLLSYNSSEKFNIIYMRMVLEHMESPRIVIKKISKMLKPRGKLVLILPDISGFEVKLYKKYAYTLQVPYHLYHFSPKTIKLYLKRFGFNKIKIYHEKFDRDLIAPINFIIRENSNHFIAKLLFNLATKKILRGSIIKIIVNVLALLGKTSRMTVIAQKKK